MVWILLRSWQHDDSEVLGVFTTRARAAKAQRDATRRDVNDGVVVESVNDDDQDWECSYDIIGPQEVL